MSVQRQILWQQTLPLKGATKCLYFIISDSFQVLGASASLLSLSAFLCQKHEVEIDGARVSFLFSHNSFG